MAEFALVGPADEIKTFASNVDPTVQTKPGWRWLPVERSESGAGVVREPPVTTVLADKVTVVTPRRDKTAQELDSEATANIESRFISGVEKALATALFQVVNDVRVLKGQGTITVAQFKAYLKGLQ